MVKGREMTDEYVCVALKDCVKNRLTGSGFEHMFDVDVKPKHISSLLEALTKVYDPETCSFKIGQNNIYFGLQDILMITGLPIDGKPVVFPETPTNAEDCLRLVGVAPGANNKKNELELKDLATFINGVDDNSDDESLDKACRAATLYGIACMVDNNTHTTINTRYVNMVRDVQDIKTFAWGTTSWVNLHSSLKSCKEGGDKVGIFGCSFSLMVFAFARIPNIIPYCYKSGIAEITPTFPLRVEYIKKIDRKEFYNNSKKPKTDTLLDVLSVQTKDDLIWEPYTRIQLPEQYLSQTSVFESITTAFTRCNAVHHTPDVAYQQLMDKEPKSEIIDQLKKSLPKVPNKRQRSYSKDIDLWLKSWESRKLHIISIDNLPSPQPSPNICISQPSMDMAIDLNQPRDLKNKLIVLDINGVLVDCAKIPDLKSRSIVADLMLPNSAVFTRPSYLEFLEFCFDNFEVGIWSSKQRSNIDPILNSLMKDLKHKFLFCWDQSHCTKTTYNTPENSGKKIIFKDLNKLWDKEDPSLCWEKGFFDKSNTLLIDDSPYKGMLNPEYTSVYPESFTYWRSIWDTSLAKGGELRDFLEGLAKADDMRNYVRDNPFGNPAVSNKDKGIYTRAKKSILREFPNMQRRGQNNCSLLKEY